VKGGITHGLIDVSRTVLTPDGQIVFLDPAFGAAVERLNLSRTRLWTRFGIASPSGDGPVRFDAVADIAQVALGTVALVLGRNLRTDEYPDALLGLLMEVIEVAQIRGTSSFATGLQRFLQRSLPIPGRRPYSTADEALFDVRQLVRRDIGADVCRQAVVDFAAQMDAAFPSAPAEDHEGTAEAQRSTPSKSSHSPRVPELHELIQGLDQLATVTAGSSSHAADVAGDDADETDLSLELDVHSPVLPAGDLARGRAGDNNEIYDLPPIDEFMAEATLLSPTSRAVETAHQEPRDAETAAAADTRSRTADAPRDPVMEAALQEFIDSRSEWELPPPPPEPVVDVAIPALVDFRSEWELPPQTPEPLTAPAAAAAGPEPKLESEPTVVPAPGPPTPPLPQDVASVDAEPESEKDIPSSRRRKRQQQKSARARKDKLRSTTAQKAPPPPVPQPEAPRPVTPTGWLVSPQRAAAFEPPVPIPPPAPAPPPPQLRSAPVPAVPSFSPTLVGALPQQPVYPAVASTSPYASRAVPSTAPPPVAPPPVLAAPPPAAPVKLKAEPPSGFAPKRSLYAEQQTSHVPAERFGTLGLGRPDSGAENEARAFPWKLAGIAVGVAIIAIILGQMYLPGRTAIPGEAGAPADASSAAAPTVPAEMADTPIPAGRGRLVIQTQPPGVKVMLDRRLVGETPLQLDVPPGRRILTFLTTGGEVIHSARVVAGKTEKVDLAVFNGWAAIFAPIVLDVAINGKKVGTTEQNRLMLPPGRHQLTLSNKDFDYSVTREAVIEPGEVFSISVDPRGTINLNAVPWAEVWLDGQKLGDTPLADLSVPLGLHEFVFKNPQFGERKVIATIKLNDNAPLAVDFSK
jgi:hypothetical protein